MDRRYEFDLLIRMLNQREHLQAALRRKDSFALAVVAAYQAWYDAPDDATALHALGTAFDAFVTAHRRTVLA